MPFGDVDDEPGPPHLDLPVRECDQEPGARLHALDMESRRPRAEHDPGGCLDALGGEVAVIGGTRTVESTITNFETCETPEGDDYCPKGTIEDVNESKRKTALKTFDGSTSARIEVSKPKGDKVSIWTLSCTPR